MIHTALLHFRCALIRVDMRYLEQNIESLYKHMGKLQSAITLIQRHESTIPAVKLGGLIRGDCNKPIFCTRFRNDLISRMDFLISD